MCSFIFKAHLAISYFITLCGVIFMFNSIASVIYKFSIFSYQCIRIIVEPKNNEVVGID